MTKAKSYNVSVRIPIGVVEKIDEWAASQKLEISRSAAIVYLLTKGLHAEGVKVKE